MKIKILTGFLLMSFALCAQTVYRTNTLAANIRTLQTAVDKDYSELPILTLNADNTLQISFDEMSHEPHYYTCTVLHCNADWTISNLNSSEYLDGFTTSDLESGIISLNSTYQYSHYQFSLPNDNIRFKISGNFVALIYENGNKDNPVAQVCFSVVDPKIKIDANLRGNTDIDLMGKMQQLDFSLNLSGYVVRDPQSELKIVVRQNNRIDNQVVVNQPTFFQGDNLSFINQKNLIFEGGNEFHQLDISSFYSAYQSTDNVKYDGQHYRVNLIPDKIQTSSIYQHHDDANGRFLVHFQESFENEQVEADYAWVHFSIPTENPFFDGQIYIGGDWNYQLNNERNRMFYNNATSAYEADILLKQGGYSYQYLFMPKDQSAATVSRIDGSHWQTLNEYTIYVYHRPWGERYDRLIGVTSIQK